MGSPSSGSRSKFISESGDEQWRDLKIESLYLMEDIQIGGKQERYFNLKGVTEGERI